MSLIDLGKNPEESELAYIQRLGRAKSDGLLDMTWQELADVFNRNLREDHPWTESAYRKRFANMKQLDEEFGLGKTESNEVELTELRREIEKEKVKLRDERTAYNKLLREEARKESYQEQFIHSIEEAASKHPLKYDQSAHRPIIRGNATLVIPLSDIHCGIEIHNYWNDYDVDILRAMLNEYLDKLEEIAIRHGAEDVVVLATELVSGTIHNNLRLQNNQDLIDQFLIATDYVCDFLRILSMKFNRVDFYVAPGNHGRLNQKKEDSLVHENIENLVVPYVRAKMQAYTNIRCHDNEVAPGIVTMNIDGQKLVFVHGDLDNMNNATKNMTKALGYTPEIIVLAHRHFNAHITDGKTKVIQSGSFVGTDEYAASMRLFGCAEQSPFIVSSRGVECIYDVRFS